MTQGSNGTQEFRLPDVGEGLVEAEIVSWKVKPGDTVRVNDVIAEIETAKSLVELPSPYAGVVTDLLVPEGQVVPVGTPIIRVAGEGAAGGPGGPEAASAEDDRAAAPAAKEQNGGRTSVLVGYGPRTGSTRRRPRKTTGAAGPTAGRPPAGPRAQAGTTAAPPSSARPAGTTGAPPPAKPPVRKLAKDLGVNLRDVVPTGPGGTISRQDVEAYAARKAGAHAGTSAPETAAGPRETRVPIRGLRRATAEAVTRSAFTAPHVTEWITVDMTASMELLDRLRARRSAGNDERPAPKLTPLVLVAKACCLALRRTPELNAFWDEDAGEIVLRHYVNLGIAVASSRGLLVPHLKNAERMALPELASALAELVRTAREGRTPVEDLQGTTFTITNVGVFGVDGGTPILNPGETGILAFGAVRRRPWVMEVDGEERIVPRWVTTLSLSFDHRVVDGEQGSRFLTDVADILTDPGMALTLA